MTNVHNESETKNLFSHKTYASRIVIGVEDLIIRHGQLIGGPNRTEIELSREKALKFANDIIKLSKH